MHNNWSLLWAALLSTALLFMEGDTQYIKQEQVGNELTFELVQRSTPDRILPCNLLQFYCELCSRPQCQVDLPGRPPY